VRSAEILDGGPNNASRGREGQVNGLDSRHGHMEEAVNSTPHVAKTEFYRH